tara:strand:+ start:105 stop:980 length:876 start_codon:yes stop_codon:yes gene_type:complete
MKAQFDQTLLSSFYLWFENYLLKDKSKAYSTDASNTFKYVDFADVPSSHYGYQGQFKQLVGECDVDVPNSGFFSDGGFVTGDNDSNGGVFTDYDNGRLIFPSASGTGLTLTANSTVKEVNTYISYDGDLATILHSDFKEAGASFPYQYSKDSELDEQIFFLPACFISLASSDNVEFSFGGEENTESRVRVMILSSDNYIMDSVMSLFRDSVRSDFKNVPYEDFPYGPFYSIKNYPYKYDSLISGLTDPEITHIKNVNVSKVVSEQLRENLNKGVSIGFIDFDLCTYRFPRL